MTNSRIPLVLQFIPPSCTKQNARLVLSGYEWIRMSRTIRSKKKCVHCRAKASLSHEVWKYDASGSPTQILESIVPICRRCHVVIHNGKYTKPDGIIFHNIMKWLVRVNKVPFLEAKIHFIQSQETFQKNRKIKNWALDLSVLQQYGIDVTRARLYSSLEVKELSVQK